MMLKLRLTLVALFALILTVSAGVQANASLPTPCLGDAPNVYLIINGYRDHIVDWETFLNLGYLQSDIVPCSASDMSDPLGQPITRLFKGSDPAVYWLKDGVRHHIPDMDTFTALGFQTSQISVLPDSVLALWPLGGGLTSTTTTSADTVYDQQTIGMYTIRLWHPAHGLTNFATISTPGQPDVRIDDVESIGGLPAANVTGDGLPDVEFPIRSNPGSVHCCSGTVVYELGASPLNILSVLSPADQLASTGIGEFQDLNGDGAYEFIVQDPLTGIACSQPNVTAILSYDSASGRYVGASPHFASYYNDEITQFTAQAAVGDHCSVYPLIETLLYMGRMADAQTAFNSFYHGSDAADFWAALQTAAQAGRFYTS